MSCPTCDHTMSRTNGPLPDGSMAFWCPRCGTLRLVTADRQFHDTTPALVARCRTFAVEFWGNLTLPPPIWFRLGIAEAINKPEDRPQ